MKKFLFITHLTPAKKRSALRTDLMSIMRRSLLEQKYSNWKALFIGEEETLQSPIKTVDLQVEDRSQVADALWKLYERNDVQDYINDCDLLLKLDDDDVISPHALENAAAIDFDCYCDRYHTFYDVTSGSITSQKRNWIASTAIHKKEHAFKKRGTNETCTNFTDSLFYGDHGRDWISYYADKKIIHTPKEFPLYLRILSPISHTAGAGLTPKVSLNDIDLDKYYEYLKQFGAWNAVKVQGFENYLPLLDKVWENFSGSARKPIPGIPYSAKLKSKLRDLLNG